MFPRFTFWLQENRREVVLFALFFLVSAVSFALGYIVAGEAERPAIIIEKNSEL